MKILICGGHLTPALALIKQLPSDIEILYVGRLHPLEGDNAFSLEYQTMKSHNIPFKPITTGRIQRIFSKYTIASLLKMPLGFAQALKIVALFHPDVVVGFGGYVSVPLCLAAKILRIPIVIHEQTFEAGLANKFLARFANTICISWETSKKFFPKDKTVLTGNPAVSDLTVIPAPASPKLQRGEQAGESTPDGSSGMTRDVLPRLVIIGGSLGSHVINLLVEGCLEELLKNFTILHQTGSATTFGDYERLKKYKATLPETLCNRYTITSFITPENIIGQLQKATLVISRAGINTITTLLLINKPTLLIPLPVSQHNEQQKNAQFLASYHLAEILDQTRTTSQMFLQKVLFMKTHLPLYHNNKPTEQSIHHNATQRMIAILASYAKYS